MRSAAGTEAVVNDLDRIEQALRAAALSPAVFERCAQDLLSTVYPGLSPIPGGTDWGRDADVAAPGVDGPPPRLLATSARTLEGVRKNMLKGIKSLDEHGVAADRLVLANPANLSLVNRQSLVRSAEKAGKTLDVSDIFDRGFFASRLRRDGYWRNTLLGLPSGPISLTRLPADLAESPWSFLPLVARDDDKTAISVAGDILISGPPGVGKSRLAAELDQATFVDTDADLEQVAADLRWAQPTVVIIDDAAGHTQLIRRLRTLRATEADVFTFRLVCICWPDGLADLQAELPDAVVHNVQLLERGPLDRLLREMGISSTLARGEILDQAEGRPGWAVALADLLLRADDAGSLLNGKALLGHVDRYLRRAGIDPEAVDILAVVAALGEVAEDELRAVAAELDVRRSLVANVLTGAARSGLIDVREDRSRDVTRKLLSVRPPMLADVLIAERAFSAPAPLLDFDGLAGRWPTHVVALARAAIEATALGATAARRRAEVLLNRALADATTSHASRIELSSRFLRLDENAARRVLDLARTSLDESVASDPTAPWVREPVVKLAAEAARRFQLEAAMQLLFDACLVDTRPTNPNTGHPLRQIAALVTAFHPELPLAPDVRYAIADALMRWVHARSESAERDRVAADILQLLFGLQLQSAHSDPGNPLSFQLVEAVLPAALVPRVFADLWPHAATLLAAGNDQLPDVLVDVATEWLRIGGGFDRPFGRAHASDQVDAIATVSRQLVQALAERPELTLGTRVRLQQEAARYSLAADAGMPANLEPFFRDVERGGADWDEAEKTLAADVESVVRGWEAERPPEVVARLVELRRESTKAHVMWPDRVALAVATLAAAVDDPVTWADECEAQGLLPEGMPFVGQAFKRGLVTADRAAQLLVLPNVRGSVVHLLLTAADAPPWALDVAIGGLTTADFRLLEMVVLRDEITQDQLKALLTRTSPEVRSLVAVATLIGRLHADSEWRPGALEPAWVDAMSQLRPAHLAHVPGYSLKRALGYLAGRYPALLAAFVSGALGDVADGSAYQALPHDTWGELHLLPRDLKTSLWRRFKDRPWSAYLLLEHLTGPDVAWVGELIAAGDLTPADALGCYRGFGQHRPTVQALAEVLVPAGVDPAQIAIVRSFGSWTGPQSARYQSIIDEFEELRNDASDAVRRVAEAGMQVFASARDEALAEEHRARVRGEP